MASARFDAALDERRRTALALTVTSCGGTLGPWAEPRELRRTYAGLRFDSAAVRDRCDAALGDARIDEPPLVALEIVPAVPARLSNLMQALGGTGRPRGVRDCTVGGSTLVVEFDPAITPLAFVIDVIDVVAPERQIRPLLPVSDATLARFAADVLGVRELAADRIIEPYVEQPE
ncbi:MAG: hypothetical protein ACREM8_03510 [Vulcanimicrobiaceae bacterium]